ncbi:MAG TPA: C4-type zinc ribbon domain-containing protein [Chthoniobacterales bacterium]|jgi:hypothetical protein
MLPQIEQLLVLQDRDQKIKAFRDELTRAPLEKQRIADDLARATAEHEKARAALQELEIRKKKLELDSQAKRDSIAKFKNQQFQTRKNEEFQALSHEIARYEKDIIGFEDTEIEIMESIEQQKIALAASDAKFAEAKRAAADRTKTVDERVASIQGRIGAVEAERAALVGTFSDEDLLDLYNRLFAKKVGTAVVPLDHETCGGCHMKVTPQIVHSVRGNKVLTHCEQCGRILYPGE